MTCRPWAPPSTRWCALALTLTLSPLNNALAQSEPAASAPDSRMERAQKAADAVFRWIKLNADKPGVRANAPAPAPAPTAAAPASPPPAALQTPVQRRAPARPTLAQTPPAASTETPPPAVPASALAQAPAPQAASSEPTALAATPASTPAQTVALATPASPRPTAAPAPAPEPEPEELQPLQLVYRVEPTMPRLPPQLQRDGMAQVQFTVQPDGHVSQAQVIKASHSRYGTAAVDAVRLWRFSPIAHAREAAVEIRFNTEN